jgi:hypothetical protein
LQVAYTKLFEECIKLKRLNKKTFTKLNEDDLQVAYTKLFEECIKLKKLNKKTFTELNEVELEKESFLVKRNDSYALNNKLKLDIIVLNDKSKLLENELNESKDQ